jgi:hypothetical protein
MSSDIANTWSALMRSDAGAKRASWKKRACRLRIPRRIGHRRARREQKDDKRGDAAWHGAVLLALILFPGPVGLQ